MVNAVNASFAVQCSCPHTARSLLCQAAAPTGVIAPISSSSGPALKQAARSGGPGVDPAYLNGAAYLKGVVGITNPAEVARVLDISMNPNSLFMDTAGKRFRNASARTLDVEQDMKPVVDFLLGRGMTVTDVCRIVSGHPPILSYSVPDRLEPFWAFFEGLGVKDVGAAIIQRPTVLGLDVDKNLRKIVGYLESIETPPERIVELLVKSI